MNPKRVMIWLSVLIGLVVLALGGSWLLAKQDALTAANLLAFGAGLAAYGWLIWGLARTRKYRVARQALIIVVTGTWTLMLSMLLLRYGYQPAAIAFVGMWTMVSLFIIGLALIRLVLSGGTPLIGVARTLVDEAIRMKIALVFLVGMSLLIPFLPLFLDSTEQLRYRVKFFLSWSLGGTSILLSGLTIFLACWTICTEVESKQIFMTMVKPISRAQYLLGKWLGISLLNLLLVGIAGGTIYFLTYSLAAQRAQTSFDRMAIQEQVLVARRVIKPTPPESLDIPALFRAREAEMRISNPDMEGRDLTAKQQNEILTKIYADWHSIGPREQQTYVFEGMDNAKTFGRTVQLRWKPAMTTRPPDEMARMQIWLNGYAYPYDSEANEHMLVPAKIRDVSTLDLPLESIDDKGILRLTILNPFIEGMGENTISFAPGKDLEILYKVGSFEMNMARSLGIIWVQLVFLAILGLFTGTFLGFAVASLMSCAIYLVALSSAFLSESLGYFAGLPDKDLKALDKAFALFLEIFKDASAGKFKDASKTVIRVVGETFMAIVPSLSDYNPVPLVSDGREVSLDKLLWAVLTIGVIWGGGCAIGAWLVFRRRELARVTV